MAKNLTDQLEKDIIFGALAAGSRIVEDRVIEQYKAKRNAVRRAFTELESMGLLVRIPNRGVEVVQFTPDEVDNLYQIRILLETGAAKNTPLPAPQKIIDKLKKISALHAEAVQKQDVQLIYKMNQEFHKVQYSCCGNERLATLIENHAKIAQPIRVINYDNPTHMETVVAQHEAIIEALASSSQETYVQATKEHLPASAKTFRLQYERRFGS